MLFKFLLKRARWIIAIVGVLVFWLAHTDWVKTSQVWGRANSLLIDRRYLLRATKAPNPNIQLLGVQTSSMTLDALPPEDIAASETLQLMREPWPWNRRVYAAVLEKLMAAGAKVVVFDFILSGASEGDTVFAKALEKYKDHVVMGAALNIERDENRDVVNVKLSLPNSRLLSPGTEKIVGLVSLWPDSDGIVRSTRYQTSLARELNKGLNRFPDDLSHMTLNAVEKYGEKVNTPLPDQLSYIDFQGPSRTYQALPLEDIFVEKTWRAKQFNSGMVFSNKIVVVGPMAEIFKDTHFTPLGEMPGPEIQGQMMAALLDHSFIRPSPESVDEALDLLMIAVALGVCLWKGNASLKVLLLALATVAFLVAAQFVFVRHNLVLSMTGPLFCLAATGSFGVVFQSTLEQFEKLRFRNVLDRYVSKNVAKAILDDKRSFLESLNGRKQEVTILFMDIRGFTSMTETTDPDKLVAQLNEYFFEMVGIVLKEGGTLQKFIGDAIMAGWGDTHTAGSAEDARRAVSAALQMRGELMKLNKRWTENPDRTPFSVGIGVNQGELIVGNIGHPQRMEFTVLGDGVNLASRLESATRQFHSDILIGESIHDVTSEHFVYRRVDLLTMKGKAKPVEVFTVLGDRSTPVPGWLSKYHEAIFSYRRRNFGEAIACLKEALKEIGREDYLCEMYIRRCEEFLRTPPPSNWDCSHALSEK
jgi:adenylate cyclase